MGELIFISSGIAIVSILSLVANKIVNVDIISKKIKDSKKAYILIFSGLFALINLIIFIGVGHYFDEHKTLNNIQDLMVVFFIGVGVSYQFTSVVLFGDKILLETEYNQFKEEVIKGRIGFSLKRYIINI